MKFVAKIVVIALACGIAQLYMPWWIIAVIPFVVELLIKGKSGYGFFSGFYGVALLWFTYSLALDMQTSSILSEKIATLFQLPAWSISMVILAGLLGGLVGGVSSLSGSYLRALLTKDE